MNLSANELSLIAFFRIMSDGMGVMLICHAFYSLIPSGAVKRSTADVICVVIFFSCAFRDLYEASAFSLRAYHALAYMCAYIIYSSAFCGTMDMVFTGIYSIMGNIFLRIQRIFTFFTAPAVRCGRKTVKKVIKKLSALLQKVKKVYNIYITYFRTGRKNETEKEQDTKKG